MVMAVVYTGEVKDSLSLKGIKSRAKKKIKGKIRRGAIKRELYYRCLGLCVGGCLKPETVCQHQSLLIPQILLYALSTH